MSDETRDRVPRPGQTDDVPHAGKRKRRAPFTKAQRLVLQEEALALKVKGESYSAIGRYLSHPSYVKAKGLPDGLVITKVAAFKLVMLALQPIEKVVSETANKLRSLQVCQHNEIIKALWPQKSNPRAADSIGRQMERIAKLRGLDAPTKVRHSGEVASTPALPLSLLTEEELDQYERLAVAVSTRKKAADEAASKARAGQESEPGTSGVEDEDEQADLSDE